MLTFFRYLALPSAMPNLLVSVRLLAPIMYFSRFGDRIFDGLAGPRVCDDQRS